MSEKNEAAPLPGSLRDRIGQAISDEIAAGAEQPDWCDSREIDRLADAVLAVLPEHVTSAAPAPRVELNIVIDDTLPANTAVLEAGGQSVRLRDLGAAPTARSPAPIADLSRVGCWVFDEESRDLCKSTKFAADIVDTDNAYVCLSVVKRLFAGGQQHAQAVLSDEHIIAMAADAGFISHGDGCLGILYKGEFSVSCTVNVLRLARAILATRQPAPIAADVAQGVVPPVWISEVCGPEVDDLSYGQGFRNGFNQCRGVILEALAAEPPADAAPVDAEEDAYVIDRMGKLLAGVAIALKGAEKALHRHGYQDLPDLAGKVMLELELHRHSEAAQPSPAKGDALSQPACGIKPWEQRLADSWVNGQGENSGWTDEEAMKSEIADWRAQAQRATSPPDSERDAATLAPAVHRGFGQQLFRTRTPEELACWCHICRPITMEDSRMVLCPTCGYKRCPRANDHNNACTGSNEPGQTGSAYARWPAAGGGA